MTAVSDGIERVDQVLAQELCRGRPVLLVGGPGAGKDAVEMRRWRLAGFALLLAGHVLPGWRCGGRGGPIGCGRWYGLIRLLCSQAGTSGYVPEAVGVLVGVMVAAKLLADPSAGPSPGRLAVIVSAGVVGGLLPPVLTWVRDSRLSRRQESGGGCGGSAAF